MRYASLFITAMILCLLAFEGKAQTIKTVGPSGDYTTLKLAFDAINAGTISGDITLQITGSTTETASAVLNASGTGGASYTAVSISPTTSGVTISGNITGALVDLNGADHVSINGQYNGNKELTLSNTATGSSSTVRFIGDASNNTITNCNLLGSSSTAAYGVVLFSTGKPTTGVGNDSNTISNCNIGPAGSNLPINAFYSAGTSTAIDNSGNTLDSNNIYDYFSATLATNGIYLSATGNSAWTITNNKLYQSATRVYTTGNTHNGIYIGVGSGYTISGNTIGFANASGTGTTNLVGNSVALTGTFPGSWSTTGTANGTKLIAINCSFTAAGSVSNIQGNTVAGIALFTSSTTSTANGILCGIQLLSGNANIGTTSPNTFGASSGQNSLYTASTGTGGTIVGIYTTSANTVNIQNNIFGAIDAVGTTTSASGGFTGIDVAGSGNYSITGNLIGNTTAGNIRTGYSATSGNLSNTGTMASSSGASSIVGIRSAATGNTLNISSNTLKGFITSGTATTVTGIISSGAMTGTTPSASINSNLLGTAEVGWINYLSANSGPLAGISLSNTIATTHSVQNNDLRGIIHAVAGSQTHTYITLTGATAASNVASISGNTFTNLNVNTTGSVVFIFHGYSIAATGRLTISNNSIVTGFNRASAGSVTITNSDGSSVAGSVNNYLDNNFSNITVTGTSAITGFNNIDGGAGSAKTVTGNTFTNWTGGSGAINVMSFTCWCGTSGLSNNTISDITGQSTVTGINIGASSNNATSVAISSNTLNNLASSGAGGNVTGITCNNTSPNISISENTISNLSATGTSATLTGIAVTGANSTSVFQNTIYAFSGTSATAPIANGISVSAGTTVNVYKNKIYDLQESGAITTAGVVNGLLFSGGTTVTAYNNLIGDLRTPAANQADAIRGISITSGASSATFHVYHNTVRLAATSSGTNFGTSGIYHTASSTATTSALNLRNNIVVNSSTANGTGKTVAYRRSGTTLTNYASTSNNNLFYAGTPSSSNLIFNDGINSDQTLETYKARVSTRDNLSVTEDVSFLSTNGADATFLHISPSSATLIEGGALPIGTVTDDYDEETRNATTPDIGADEGNFKADVVITYTALGNTSNISSIPLTATITSAAGINVSSGTAPRLYYKRLTDDNAWGDNTQATNGWKWVECTSPTGNNYTFNIDFSQFYNALADPVAAGDFVQYFVVAQNTLGTPVVRFNSGTPATLPLASVSDYGNLFPMGGTINQYWTLPSQGTYTLGTGGQPTYNYATLTGANGFFAGMNEANTQISGNITMKVMTDITEPATYSLNQWTETGAGNYSVTIQPDGGASRTLSGNYTGALIMLSGADRVTFNGLNSGGNSLILSNTATGASNTFRFISDASNNTITNCTILGSATTASNGVIQFGTGTVTGNDGNTISGCKVGPAGSYLPLNGIFSQGTSAAIDNSGNTLDSNNIYDYFNASLATNGICLAATGNSGWIISNNKLYQTSMQMYTSANLHNGIYVGVGSGYTISGNTIGYANASGSGFTNIMGSTTAPGGSFPTSFTLSGSLWSPQFVGINCAFTAGGTTSDIQGNTIANIAIYTGSGVTTANGVLCGINVTSGNVNIGTTSGNTIGELTGAGSLYAILPAGSGTGVVTGIYVTSANTVNISNNKLGSIEAMGSGPSKCASFSGIDVAGAGTYTITNNTIGNSSTDNIRVGYTIDGGIYSNTGTLTYTTGSPSSMVGIRSASTGATLTINNNTLRGWANSAWSTAVYGITATGANTNSVTIHNNTFGTETLGWMRNATANCCGNLWGINVSGSVAATTHSIQSNDFRGILYSVPGSASVAFITAGAGTAANNVTTIRNNTFTNLSINTTGNVNFIDLPYIVAATGTQTVTNNSIVTGFSKTASGGTVTLASSTGASVAGATINHTSNNFSNITVTGATTLAGWTNGGSGAATRTIQDNTFNNWTGGTSAVTAMNLSYSASGSIVTGNTMTNISGQGSITGLVLGASQNFNVYSNTINSLTSTGGGGSVTAISLTAGTSNLYNHEIYNLSSTGVSATVSGISVSGATLHNIYSNVIRGLSGTGTTSPVANGIAVSGGTAVNLYKNKIYNLQESGAITTTAGAVNGLLISGGTTVTAYNNIIGDLRTPAAGLTDAIRGISVTSTTASATYNVYYNTVRLSATSSGTNFGTSGIYHTSSATATTASLNLRNNIVVNSSTANGTGKTVAYRRSSATLTNYASTSNNNLFYAGTPSSGNLIFYDGTNSDQTLETYKTRVSTRDNLSVTENPPFLSTTGSDATFLHINPAVDTYIERGAATIPSITDDYDGDPRNATSPDIGADEGDFQTVFTIDYDLLSNTSKTTGHSLTASIVTPGGVNTTGGTAPRLYYKRSAEANTWVDNTNGSNGWKWVECTTPATDSYTFNFDFGLLYQSDSNPLKAGDYIQYFVVGQDLYSIPAVEINSGTPSSATPSGVADYAGLFPMTGSINQYLILPPPTVSSINPDKGPVAGGTNVTITGANFIPGDVVTGGTITYSGGYTIHTFTSDGTFQVPDARDVEVLVVAGGGGGGGKNSTGNAGGGGAGGVVYNASFAVTPQSYTVTVGNAGSGASSGPGGNGGNSTFSTLTAIGGGGGGYYMNNAGLSGGSGGGGGQETGTGGAGTTGQGNAGGTAWTTSNSAGGGGGAGQAGSNASASGGGKGGDGISYSISGSSVTYGGGGGGSTHNSITAQAAGGAGGGGAGAGKDGSGPLAAVAGTPNTGGGGGGGGEQQNGANGGSGIVIIRYPTPTLVTFGGTPASNIQVGNATTITATTPAHLAGPVDVVITNPDGVTATLSNGFTYQGPLTVTSVNPASVVKSGGVTITITGTDFTGTPTVTIGGVEATDVNRIDATTITAVTPALAAGTYHVVVTNPDTQSATLTNGITYVEPAPTVTSVNPSSGAVSGGTNVTVTGTNFMPLYDNYTKLLIHADGTNGSTTIADSEVTPKSLTANGNAAISTVKSKFGGSSVFFDGNGDYLSSPASTDWNLGGDWTIDLWLFPTSFHTSNMFPETYFNTLFSYIPASGWLQVFLNGTGQVKISSQAQGEQTWTNQTVPMYQWTHLAIVSSSTSVTVYINGVSQGSKTITTPSSSGAIQIGWDGNPEREFTGYMDEFRISKGIARWTSDFTPPTVACNPVTGPGVTFGGSSATNVVFVNSTTLTATTPAHTVGQVDLVVTNPDSQTGTLTNGFTYRDAPTITSAAPASVPNTGGTTVTINGTGFYGTPTVSIGSTTASVTAATATTLTITTPAYSAGAVDVVVANPDGQIATLTGGLTYTAPAPTVTSISPVSGPVAGGTNVTITGSDFIVSEAGTGGTITNSGLYTVHTFTSSGTFTLPTARNVEVLVVAGGGGGGKAEAVGDAAGGGGAGGVIHVTSYSASAGSLSVTVGNGGNGSTQTAITGENGGNSIFGTLIAIGGGGGGSDGSYQGVDGGSGGGAANCYESELYGFGVPSSSGTVGQGNAGGAANFEPRLLRDGSGGGGAGGPGEERANRVGGAGGIGLPFSIYNGTPIYYAGGGGGGAGNSLGGAGIHGGGNGGRFSGTGTTENGLSGTPNTGGGGGGGAVDNGNGGNGGSGIVIVRYLHTSPIVTFGGINATNVTVTSSTTLTATTPAHAAGVTDVAVTNSGGQTSTLPSSYTYINPPSINSVTPSSVLNTGGTSVTIAGTDFFGTPAVTFDGTAGTVTAVTSTSLTVTTPAHPTGIVDVVVTNPDGQYATLPNGLTYTTPASPLPESGGIITSNGGAPVTVRGICWSTSPNPTIADNKTTNGEGSGTFLTSIPGLAIATTYHVRAYATNRVGTAYGNDEVFTTHAAVPVVTTTAATSVTQNSATSGGIIVSEEGAAILAKGVCWSTSANPTTSGNTTSNGSGSSGYSSSITGLISGTTYYVRAYATNSMGTAYGNQVSFTTP